MTKGKVLVIGSNATRLDVQGGAVETGQYLNETAVPAMALVAAGYEVVLATPNGTRPHIDPLSDTADHFESEDAYRKARAYYDSDPAMNAVRTLSDVLAEGLEEYAAFFVPGGHAPIVDLMQDRDLGKILHHAHAAGKPTALLCHGPIAIAAAIEDAAAFRAAMVAGDTEKARELAHDWPYAGYRMTVFTPAEERIAEEHLLHARLHFDMADALAAAGGEMVSEERTFAPHVVVDRELITGQNPASDHALASALVAALDARAN